MPSTVARARAHAASANHPTLVWNAAAAQFAREALQQRVYGQIPHIDLRIDEILPLPEPRADINVEQWHLAGPLRRRSLALDALVVWPRATQPRVMLLAQKFRHTDAAIAAWTAALLGNLGAKNLRLRLREWVLGPNIHVPPFDDLMRAGVGVVLFHPAQLVPDHPAHAAPMIEAISDGIPPLDRGGVLAHWAAITSALRVRVSERFPATPIVAWGHSRHGKAALLAAAFDDALAGVIAHQSGRFGASLTQGARGESVRQIARAYPHWFGQRFLTEHALDPGEVDQHHLLALIAPRPLLLGNATSDFWADPKGAVRAALAASAAYRALGAAGLGDRLGITSDIAVFERAGWHGINADDWRCFLAFLDAKFAPLQVGASAADRSIAVSGP
ncbi:MAG: hypothetical protein AB7Q23_17420 [Hyphomonadaceae bacterium]